VTIFLYFLIIHFFSLLCGFNPYWLTEGKNAGLLFPSKPHNRISSGGFYSANAICIFGIFEEFLSKMGKKLGRKKVFNKIFFALIFRQCFGWKCTCRSWHKHLNRLSWHDTKYFCCSIGMEVYRTLWSPWGFKAGQHCTSTRKRWHSR